MAFGLLCSVHYIELRNSAIVILPPLACTSFAVKITRKRKMMDGAGTDPTNISENNFINHLQSVANLVIYMFYSDLHWKIVSVYINRLGQVTLKMKSRHVTGTITKKKKNIVLEICNDMPAWPGQADTYLKAESISSTSV
ncbi:hypothetical protein Sjap_001570 [Stephania japonica]|uniref:Pleckstrin-like plant domain-containing protein n=1 Tax=Stephania japonica TaxID=461633 RepID=A0AAP0PTE6_9MAGN